jgi:hypothetical protein
MGDPSAAFTSVQDFLSLMRPGVAGPAIGQGFDIPDDLVLDLEVALVALDFVEPDMVQMDEVRIIVFFETLSFEVALVAVFPGNGAITDDCPAVAFVAIAAVGEDDGVVAARLAGRGQLLPRMTVGALADRRVGFALFEMADKTGAFRDRDVLSLDDLGMAARTAEALSPSEVGQVDLVVKDDLFELDLPLEKAFFVAARPEAALVRNFGPGLGFKVKLGPVTAQLHQAFHFGPEKVFYARRIMTGAAGDVAMGRCLPALIKSLHIMTGRTEPGSGRELGRDDQKDEKTGEAPPQDQKPHLCPLLHLIMHSYANPPGDN